MVARAWQAANALNDVPKVVPHVPPELAQEVLASPSKCVKVLAVHEDGATLPLLLQFWPSLKQTTSRGDVPLGPVWLALKSKDNAVTPWGSVVGSAVP